MIVDNLLPAKSTFRLFSFGGGVQSVAVMVMQASGKLRSPYDVFAFANVGTDSENPDTLVYLEQHVKPFALKHNITLIEVQKTWFGEPDTLLERLYREQKSVVIPAKLGGKDGPPGNRNCTQNHKIDVINRLLKQQHLERAITGLGISMDEFQRARDTDWHDTYGKRRYGFWLKREYPLIDLRLSRHDCVALIERAGLPIPPKSSCWFCPFHRHSEWLEMKRTKPELFAQAVELEHELNAKRAAMRRDGAFLHSSGLPLATVVGDQLPLWADVELDCKTGYCMT